MRGAEPARRRSADLFLREADVDAHRDGEPRVHLTPEVAGAYAKGASRLLVTHVGPALTTEGVTGRAAAILGAPAASALEGDTKIM